MEKRMAVSEDSEMLLVRRSDLNCCLGKLENEIELMKRFITTNARLNRYVNIRDRITLLSDLGLISDGDSVRLRAKAGEVLDSFWNEKGDVLYGR